MAGRTKSRTVAAAVFGGIFLLLFLSTYAGGFVTKLSGDVNFVAEKGAVPGALQADPGVWRREMEPVANVAADKQGHLFLVLTGGSIAKYDGSGEQLWLRQITGISRGPFVVGDLWRSYKFGAIERIGIEEPPDWGESALIMLDRDGRDSLITTQTGSASGFDLDDRGNVYLMTEISRAGPGGIGRERVSAVSAYTRNGSKKWQVELPEETDARFVNDRKVSVGGAGRVYVLTDYSRKGQDERYRLAVGHEISQYKEGDKRWAIVNQQESLGQVVLGDDGLYRISDVYDRAHINQTALRVTKYDLRGKARWARTLNANSTATALFANGRLYLGATVSEGHPWSRDAGERSGAAGYLVTAMFDANGNLIWERRFTKERGRALELKDMKVDRQGNLYAGVSSSLHAESEPEENTRKHDQWLISKQGPGGDIKWRRTLTPRYAADGESHFHLAVDSSDGLYVGGTYITSTATGGPNGPRGFLIKYKR